MLSQICFQSNKPNWKYLKWGSERRRMHEQASDKHRTERKTHQRHRSEKRKNKTSEAFLSSDSYRKSHLGQKENKSSRIKTFKAPPKPQKRSGVYHQRAEKDASWKEQPHASHNRLVTSSFCQTLWMADCFRSYDFLPQSAILHSDWPQRVHLHTTTE